MKDWICNRYDELAAEKYGNNLPADTKGDTMQELINAAREAEYKWIVLGEMIEQAKELAYERENPNSKTPQADSE